MSSRKDPDLIRTKSLQKAFLTGSNSTCRGHIRQHYEYYSKRCKEEGIEEAERCIPPEILRARNSNSKALTQTKLDVLVGAELAPKGFTREGTLRAVTKFVACDDQVCGFSICGFSRVVSTHRDRLLKLPISLRSVIASPP